VSELDRAVATVVEQCLGVVAGEQVVVVVDEATRAIGDALRTAAAGRGAEAVLTVMDPRPRDGAEPPAAVAGALKAADVFIAPTSRSLSHTRRARRRATTAPAARRSPASPRTCWRA
jgi:leucyl aminopeptidase (aminopeptidase T)